MIFPRSHKQLLKMKESSRNLKIDLENKLLQHIASYCIILFPTECYIMLAQKSHQFEVIEVFEVYYMKSPHFEVFFRKQDA